MKLILGLLLIYNCSAQIRVNVGGPTYVDSVGNTWAADNGCVSASTYTRAVTIHGTADPTLYQTGRTDPSSISCTYTVTPSAFYQVTLKFAETLNTVTSQNPRVMNVFINGVKYYSALNVLATSQQFATAYDVGPPLIPVQGTSTITILITQQAGQPMLSALEIDQVSVANSTNWITDITNKPFLDPRSFNWAGQSPGGSLVIGSNTITLAPVPIGLNGSDIGHSVYIQGGTGAAEAVIITGGTAASGAVSGTVTFSALHTHTGAWSVSPASFGLQEAIQTISPTGGLVNITSGTWSMYGRVTIAAPLGVCVQGSGVLTTIIQWAGASSGDVFNYDGPNSSGGVGQGQCISGFQIQTTSPGNTLSTFHLDNQVSFDMHEINMVGFSRGINNTGTVSQRNKFHYVGIFNNTGDGVTLNTGLVAGDFDHLFIACTDVGLASNGIHAIRDAGTTIENSYTIGCGNEFLADPGAGQGVTLMEFTNVYFDCGPGNGFTLNPSTGGQIINIRLLKTTTACSTGSGVFLGSDGTINGVWFNGHSSLINGQHGYYIRGGSGLIFTSCLAMGNSESAANTYDGLAADATISPITDIQIIGGFYGAYWTNPNTQRYGISWSAGVVDPQLIGAQITANLTNSLSDGSTSTFKVVQANLGIGVPTLASGVTIDPGTLDPETLNLTGTTNVTNILRPWDQRRIVFIKADSGTLSVRGATLIQGGNVMCIYSSGLTTWFCK